MQKSIQHYGTILVFLVSMMLQLDGRAQSPTVTGSTLAIGTTSYQHSSFGAAVSATTTADVEGLVPDAVEYQALVDLYNVTGGASWTSNTNWLNGTTIADMATWEGITVQNGDIYRIYLNGHGLTGTIPASIGDLTGLQRIYLNSNQLAGTIPASIGDLIGLDRLYLNNNQLSGSIPSTITNLSNLIYLRLYQNSLSGSLPSDLSNMTNLRYFRVEQNNLTGALPTNLAGMSSMLEFRVNDNNFTGPIPSSLGTLTGLTVLRLQNNNLDGAIPAEIGNLTNLKSLYLNNNALTGSIPSGVENLNQVTNLYLHNNQLSGPLPASITGMTALKRLYAYNNSISGSLPPDLGSLTNLQYLRLYQNNLSGALPSSIGSLINVIEFRIENNSLTGSIPDGIGQMANLVTLRLQNNDLSGAIPNSIGDLGSANFIYLEGNNLSGSIPSTIGNLTSLTRLYLQNNQLSGPLPVGATDMANLQRLYLYNNALTGVPDFHNHVAPQNITFQIQSNYIPQTDIDANFDGAAHIFASFTYHTQGNAGDLVPDVPTGLTATAVSQSQIDLNWTENGSNTDSYNLEYSDNGGTSFAPLATLAFGTTNYQHLSLTASTTYQYKINAVNSNGTSAFSTVVGATTNASPPTSPSGLIATAASSSTINLSWTDNANNEDDFKVEYSADGTTFTQLAVLPANSTNYADNGLAPNTTRYYQVKAENSDGSSGYSNTVNATTQSGGSGTLPAPLAHWTFDNDALDQSGNGNYLVERGGVGYTADAHEGSAALNLDGQNDYANYTNTVGTSFVTGFTTRTFGVWVKTSVTTGMQELYEEGGTSNGWAIRLNDADLQAAFRVGGSGGVKILTTPYPTDGGWHHVAMVFDGSVFLLYLDGAEAQQIATGFTGMPNHGTGARLGARAGGDAFEDGGDNFYFNGQLDDARLYNEALDAGQMTEWAGVSNPSTPLNDLAQNRPDESSVVPAFNGLNRPVAVTNTDQNINYVRTYVSRIPGLTEAEININRPLPEVQTNTQYVDGLGRPNQTVAKGVTEEFKDLIQPVEYDAFGRQVREYLPFAQTNTDGAYRINALQEQYDFYQDNNGNIADTDYAFSETQLESSPLSRPLKQAAPGETWHMDSGKEVKLDYRSNIASDGAIPIWEVDNNGLPVSTDNYGFSQLTVTEITDEQGHQVVEYTDKLGQVVLKKVESEEDAGGNATAYLETHYVYDELNNLGAVIPPKAVVELNGSGTVSEDLKDWLLFIYKYDHRNRLVEKQVPGAEPMIMFYDDRDRLVLSQDGNQRADNQYLFTKYDAFNRPIITGIWTSSETTIDIQNAIDLLSGNQFYEDPVGSGGLLGYTTRTFPSVTEADLLSVTYYDGYDFPHGSESAYAYVQELDNPADPETQVLGQVTGGMVKVLNDGIWLKNITYFDDYHRILQAIVENNLGGRDRTTNVYDFQGKITASTTTYDEGGTTTSVARTFDYDHANRLKSTTYSLNGATPTTIVANNYNEIGLLEQKQLGLDSGGSPLQNVDYQYNIRGWLTHINDAERTDPNDYFGMEFYYDYGFDVNAYNGNIAGVKWQSALDGQTKAYGYTYDPLNRLTGADYIAKGTGGWTQDANRYDVGNLVYDENGNIEQLHRNGLLAPEGIKTYGLMDGLGYTYQGNRLQSVSDSGAAGDKERGDFYDGASSSIEYGYDDNGNMDRDDNKGISSITYNYLNLPETVTFQPGNYIKYTYDAAGGKHKQEVYENNTLTKTTAYLGELIFENGEVAYMLHDEGRVVPKETGGYQYQYYHKDHLGNIRQTFTADPITTEYMATMETENDGQESEHFNNLNTRVASVAANHTAGGNEAARLSASNPIGPAMSFAVTKGQQINVEAYAYYEGGSGYSNLSGINAFIGAVAGAFGGVNGGSPDQQVLFDVFDAALNGLGLLGTNNDGVPAAYLNYLFFDEDFMLQDLGYKQASNGANFAQERLALDPITITENGYLYVYVSHESATGFTFFDDLKIAHTQGEILQEDHYYPFGLTLGGLGRQGNNPFNYNGKETQDELDIGWMDFEARMFDPGIGRWYVVDPMAERMWNQTPYSFAHNNPMLFVDPDGNIPIPVIIAWLVKAGGKTFLDAGVEIALGYVTGIPPTGWTHGTNFLTNLVPGLGEAKTVKKIYRITSAIKRLSKISNLKGGSKLFKDLSNHTDKIINAFKAGDKSGLDKYLASWVGNLYEARLAARFSGSVRMLGARAKGLSDEFGVAIDKLKSKMTRTKGNLEIDLLRKDGDSFILGQAKASDISKVQSFGGWNGKSQFLDTLDVAKEIGESTGKSVKVEYYFQGDVSAGLIKDLVQTALNKGVNLNIQFLK